MKDLNVISEGYQRKIFNYIKQNPGVHLRRIQRELHINLSTLRYHINYLESNGILCSEHQANKQLFFICGKVDIRNKKLIGVLQQKRFRDLVMALLLQPYQSHKELYKRLNLNPSTLTKYLSILLQKEIVAIKIEENSKLYYVPNKQQVLSVLLTYKNSFWDRLVDSVLKVYFE